MVSPLVAFGLVCFAPVAQAADSWTAIRPGVDLLHRTTSGPQDIQAARIDLSRANIGLHASSSERGVERGVSTSTFARNADVLVAINADWSDGVTPVGLAISDGVQWHSHIVDDTLGSRWGFFGCTATKSCSIGTEQPLDSAWWFANPTRPPYRYFQATGANGIQLLDDGVARSGCYDSARNPRSAICLDAAGTTLWMVVVDGRRSGAAGMTCNEVRDLMLDLGCWDAAMLDGGGSSTLVVDGSVRNTPSDGALRTVSNHIGVIYTESVDPDCVVANGRWCDGTVIATCQGGRHLGSGDCAAYGATCEEDGDWAYCVDLRCPDGSGTGATCLDEGRIASCSDGVYGEGDCGVFGLACGEDAGGAACMDPRCEAGPHSAFCTASGALATCTEGTYAEAPCEGEGQVCWSAAGDAACVDARCTEGPDHLACQVGEIHERCTDGVYVAADCAAVGRVCDEDEGCVAEAEEEDGGTGEGDSTGGGGSGWGAQGSASPPEATGCAAAPRGSSAPGLLVGVALSLAAARRRRRASPAGPT